MKTRSLWLFLAMLPLTWMKEGSAQTPAVYSLDSLVAQLDESSRAYLPFLGVPTLRSGLYRLESGSVDQQEPHGKDEVYYVIEGRSRMSIGEREYAVAPGDVIFVGATQKHRFRAIEEDLLLLVFFSEAIPTE